MKPVRWTPFSDLETLHDRVNRIFTEALHHGSNGNEDMQLGSWMPAVDIEEQDDTILVHAELPGLKREDIDISLEDKVLTISGERKFENEDKRDNFHRIERSYGRFTRRFTIGKPIDATKVAASFRDGVLTVTLPKAEETKPKKIDISLN